MAYIGIYEKLTDGVAELKLRATEAQLTKHLQYIELLHKWNRAYSLTAIKTLADMVPHHLLDSLSIAPYVYGKTVLDIGAGAGLPGIPLAIYFPEKHFVLIDSQAKKTAFLRQAVLELDLSNVEVINQRVEQYTYHSGFDVIVVRAFARLRVILELSQHLCRSDTEILAMKGTYPKEELAEIRPTIKTAVHQIDVPGLNNARRHLVVMTSLM